MQHSVNPAEVRVFPSLKSSILNNLGGGAEKAHLLNTSRPLLTVAELKSASIDQLEHLQDILTSELVSR